MRRQVLTGDLCLADIKGLNEFSRLASVYCTLLHSEALTKHLWLRRCRVCRRRLQTSCPGSRPAHERPAASVPFMTVMDFSPWETWALWTICSWPALADHFAGQLAQTG